MNESRQFAASAVGREAVAAQHTAHVVMVTACAYTGKQHREGRRQIEEGRGIRLRFGAAPCDWHVVVQLVKDRFEDEAGFTSFDTIDESVW